MSGRTIFARNTALAPLKVRDDVIGVVHLVTEMAIAPNGDERPYGAECGTLTWGMATVDDVVNCIECLAGREALIEAIKRRLR